MKFSPLLLLLFLSFFSCSISENQTNESSWENINGRDEGSPPFFRQPIYRIFTPITWERINSVDSSIVDTMLPIVEYRIPNTDIHITIHNFPSSDVTSRIPPIAQTARWERQFEEIDPASIKLIPQSFSGFVGLRFEAIGLINSKETMIIAWALQLGEEHFHHFIQPSTLKNLSDIQIRSDVTIKVTGSPHYIKSYASQIDQFARSFELIDEIPVRT